MPEEPVEISEPAYKTFLKLHDLKYEPFGYPDKLFNKEAIGELLEKGLLRRFDTNVGINSRFRLYNAFSGCVDGRVILDPSPDDDHVYAPLGTAGFFDLELKDEEIKRFKKGQLEFIESLRHQ